MSDGREAMEEEMFASSHPSDIYDQVDTGRIWKSHTKKKEQGSSRSEKIGTLISQGVGYGFLEYPDVRNDVKGERKKRLS